MIRGRPVQVARPGACPGEDGAVALIAAGALLAMLAVLAVVVDIGRVALERRQLQQQVDAAALAGAYEVGRCVNAPNDPLSVAQRAAEDNGFAGTLADAPNRVRVGTVTTVAGMRRFVEEADLDRGEAVEVWATSEIARSRVLSQQLVGSLELGALAVAQTRALGALQVSHTAASVDSGGAALLDQILGAAIGGSLSLSAVSYEGLLGAQLTLGELVGASADAGTLEELLDLKLTAGEAFALFEAALDAQGAGAAATVAQLAAAASAPGTARLGDWMSVAAGSGSSALAASLNAFELVRASALAASGGNALLVNPLAVALPGVASASLRAVVLEPPQIAVGPPGWDDAEGAWRTRAESAHVRLELTLRASALLTVLGSEPVDLTIYSRAASAQVGLASIRCARAADPVTWAYAEAGPGLGAVGLGTFLDIEGSDATGPTGIAELEFLGAPIAQVTAESEGEISSDPETLEFEGPFVPRIASPS